MKSADIYPGDHYVTRTGFVVRALEKSRIRGEWKVVYITGCATPGPSVKAGDVRSIPVQKIEREESPLERHKRQSGCSA